jgi:hypothetical protein
MITKIITYDERLEECALTEKIRKMEQGILPIKQLEYLTVDVLTSYLYERKMGVVMVTVYPFMHIFIYKL